MGFCRSLAAVLLLAAAAPPAAAYSILSHEEVVDQAWDGRIRPVLERRFGPLTDDDLDRAHAHAYGGCLIQDIGYYPSSTRFVTDLMHYVRTGAFVAALLDDARDADEYAFALGALAHYAADTVGHSLATNRAVALYDPKLAARLGPWITYEEKPSAHIRAEFGFDVVAAAHGQFTSSQYHRRIGFEVSVGLLDRAFERTYGVRLADLLSDEKRAISTYRKTVSEIFPHLTEVAWQTHKKTIAAASSDAAPGSFVFHYTRRDFEQAYGVEYDGPSPLDRILAVVYRLMPKIGPLKNLKFRPATPETAQLFRASLAAVVARYGELVAAAGAGRLDLEDRDLDTDRPVAWGESALSARTYVHLVAVLSITRFRAVSAPLQQDILRYFEAGQGARPEGVNGKDWKQTRKRLAALRALEP